MLKGKRVTLRALEREDLPNCHRWLNDEEVTRHLGRNDPLSMVEEEQWFEKQVTDKANLVFAIEDEDGNYIGNISLHKIDFRNGTAEIGIVIGEKDAWGKGYGPEATLVLLRYAFEDLRLHRVRSAAFAENLRSIRCQEKCGFVREGVRREAIFRFGRWHDLTLFGILAEEFLEQTGSDPLDEGPSTTPSRLKPASRKAGNKARSAATYA